MSVSKLESLPNEILIDILEKYINGIDILNAFAFHLNRRFAALITQCQRLRFDFMKCRKDDFRLCIGLLPTYADNVQELALSEQRAPGQIHAFLSTFPSFVPFKRLRTVYFHFNAKNVEPAIVQKAFYSLSKITLDKLSIKVTQAQTIYGLDSILQSIFGIPTLKRFSIACDSYRMRWEVLTRVSSNIECLTISGIPCDLQDLKHIFQCASRLKYLNIQVRHADYRDPFIKRKILSENNTTLMPALHTVIFDIEGFVDTLVSTLEPYLRCMPSLHRLEIKTRDTSFDASAWEILLKTSLPMLTCFNLVMSKTSSKTVDIKILLESFQTPFWIEKKNFNIIIMQQEHSNHGQNLADRVRNLLQYSSYKSVGKLWIGPRREFNGKLSSINKISSLDLATVCSSLFKNYYFDNVNHLVLRDLNDQLLESMMKHIDCSRIRHLDVRLFGKTFSEIPLLFSYMRNISSLRMKLSQILAYQNECVGNDNCLTCLDVSGDRHSFNQQVLLTIAKLFPKIEHLIINTPDLRNVPLLQIYLPRLRSFTFKNVDERHSFLSNDYLEGSLDEDLRRQSQFLFQRETDWITVWIDKAALKESFWEIIDNNSSEPLDDLKRIYANRNSPTFFD